MTDVYELDTNVLLRFLTADIAKEHQLAVNFIQDAHKHRYQLQICEPVFVETAVILKNYFKFPKEKIVNFLRDLLNSSLFTIENHSRLRLSVEHYSQNSIDFVDAILLTQTQTHSHRLFTFDSKLQNLASLNS